VIVHCERCDTRFELDDARVAGGELRVRCSHCKHTFLVDGPVASGADALDLSVGASIDSGSHAIDDLLDPSPSEAATDEDWEFAEPSEAPGESGAVIGESVGAESPEEVLGVEDPPALEPLARGESLASPEEASDRPDLEAEGDAEQVSGFATEEVDGALEELSAWEPEENSEDEVAGVSPELTPVPPVLQQTSQTHPVPEVLRVPHRVGTSAGWLAVIFLFVAGLHAGVAVEARPEFPASAGAELGGYRLSGIEARWVDNLHVGPLLVVSGQVERLAGTGMTPLGLHLLDAEGAPLAGEATPLGPALPLDVLRLGSPQEIWDQQFVLGVELGTFAQREWRRFDAVFAAVPHNASSVRLGHLLE